MPDSLAANVKTLAVAVGSSILVGVVVYALGSADTGALRGRVAELRIEIDGLRAAQSSTEQRLTDADLQRKAAILRMDELATRLDAAEKALIPPAPVVAAPPAEAEPAAPVPAPEPAATAKPAQ
ncbi:MAG: hypothetical protein Q7R40_03340 [Phaeospirillum sp.]|nr:hypothetical protein [Phaeospirillum sp.]